MGQTSKKFQLATLSDLQSLIEKISVLENHPDFARQYSALPEDITHGEKFSDIVHDNLLESFGQLMVDIPKKALPKSVYQLLIQNKKGKELSHKTSAKRMRAQIKDQTSVKPSVFAEPPEFIGILHAIAPEKVRRIIEAAYINFLSDLYAQSLEKTDFQPFASAHLRINKLQSTFYAANNFSLSKSEFEELVDSSYTALSSKTLQPSKSSHIEGEVEDEVESSEESEKSDYDTLHDLYTTKKESMPTYAQGVAEREFKRLKREEGSTEYNSTVDYLELLLGLPWSKTPKRRVSLKTAEQILNNSHYGMEKVKQRCIELIAAQNSSGQSGGVVCLLGPPGVGKTSIAMTLAKATRRKVDSIAMGGIHDETHMRGFKRGYSGARPGVIIESMQEVGVTNPIIILDEAGEIGKHGAHGSPMHALLEILDPTQNTKFKDHFLRIGFDLSDVLFVITANNLDRLPAALIDRMEIIRLNAYTAEEKFHIARDYLIPKHLKAVGLTANQLKIKDDTIWKLIDEYTQEAGVRGLEKQIKRICRAKNVLFQKKKAKSATVSAANVQDVIGPPKTYKARVPDEDKVGVVTGLYFSDQGGGILPIQIVLHQSDKFDISVTGFSGKMTDESAKYAMKMLRFFARKYDLDSRKLNKTSVNIHFPDASVEKDGPSAGIAISTALISALKNIPIRRDVAMTGEVDARGNVLPIGGLTEKLEGARAAGATTVIIPWDNQNDLYDVPKSLKDKLAIKAVKTIDEVFSIALTETLPEIDASAILEDLPFLNDDEPLTVGQFRQLLHQIAAGSVEQRVSLPEPS